MVYITVEPSLQHIIRNWKSNTSERTYYWGYICEGNGTRAAQNYSTNVSRPVESACTVKLLILKTVKATQRSFVACNKLSNVLV